MLFPLGFDAKLEYEQSESKEETMRNKKRVIFATSTIAPELDDPKYTIGESYTRENKSLKMYR